MPAYITTDQEREPQLQRLSDLLRNVPGKLGAVLRRIVQFVEPDPRQLTPLPGPVGRAFIFERGGKEFAGPLYHGTSSGLLESIMREGLRPWREIKERIGSIWRSWEQPRRAGVYFTRDPAQAYRYAELAAEGRTAEGLPGGGEPVVIRVEALPASRLVQDEDVVGRARAARLAGVSVPSGWRASFVMHPEQRYDVLQLAAALRPEVAEAVRQEPLRRRFHGLGTAAYRGTVPPGVLEVLSGEDAASLVLQERGRLHNRLAQLVADILARGEELPWWLR